MIDSSSFDVIIIGAGPGGYVGAIRAAQLGLRVALIEAEELGGVCLNWGCIPTKALLKTAEMYRHIHEATEFGLNVTSMKVDWKKVIARSRHVSNQLTRGIAGLMKKNTITVVKGWGSILGKDAANFMVRVTHGNDERLLEAAHVIVATGATAKALPHVQPNHTHIWTARDAMTADKRPDSLLVIGSGAIGIEFASFYNTFGTKVTVIEIQDRILPVEDREVSAFMEKSLAKQGISLLTNTTVSALKPKGNLVEVVLKDASGNEASHQFDRVLSAVGIAGNVANIGLEKTKAVVEKSQIITDSYMETAEPGVYAIGDVTGGPWLAHKASHEAVIAIEHIAKQKTHALDKSCIPSCTYSYPQVASVGISEAEAVARGLSIKVGKFPFIGNGKALASGEIEGFIKTIFDAQSGELLGAHMIGDGVTELIHGFVLAKSGELTEAEIMKTVYPHPTMSEMIHESVLQAFDRPLHI
ncbi:MAG: dihydrolipoyl dehydrogenase [Alphaproteobacteria bacterium]|nr:MAG: dihydrolipoyl dehydrogenase [Alphaproteobacteria bacterium]